MATGLSSGSIAWMSLRGALAAFDSDEKHLVLILDKLCQSMWMITIRKVQ